MTDARKSLKDYGVKDGDMVMMDRIRRQQRPAAPAPAPAGSWDFSQIQIPSNLRAAGGGTAAAGSSQPRQQAAAPAAGRSEDDPGWIREMLAA